MSEAIEQLARRLVIGHKRDGRSIYDAQTKRELVRACQQPGISMAKIARKCGINANVLSNWVRLSERAKATAPAAGGDIIEIPAPAFVPVQLESKPPPPPSLPPQAPSGVDVQIRLPNGVVVDMQGCELQHAGQLIEVLGRLRCSASTKA